MLVRIVLTVAFLVSGCSMFQRSRESGYAGGEARVGRGAGSGSMSEPSTEGLTADQLETLSQRRRLRQLESSLTSKREKEQYSKILPWLISDAEKIEFLSLGGLESRQAWINSKNIWQRAQAPDPRTKEIVDGGDIEMGMPMEYVKKAWGEPQSVEASGNPLYKNERWKYVRFVSSPDGYKQERRFVYFEGGRVVGWETE